MKFCGDCLANEGERHEDGCDQERCFICKGQKISCGCKNNNIREIHFDKPFFCAKCGEKMPELFNLSDRDWKFICGATFELDCVLCRNCCDFIMEKRNDMEGVNE